MLAGLQNLFVKAFRDAERESALQIDPERAKRAGRGVMVVCLSAALCLTSSFYLSRSDAAIHAVVGSLFGLDWVQMIDRKEYRQLARLIWWAAVVVHFQLIVPALIVKCVLRRKLGAFGCRLRGAFTDWPVYCLAGAVILPLVWFASTDPGFLKRYPFYSPRAGEGLWPMFALWEVAYLLQFAAVEFFFRGFMLHGTKDRFGFYAVFATVVPYCMIHFEKPLPETLAAIVAGIVLGVFSLKSGSIVPGFLLHCGTALSMDFAALFRKGLL
jgi:membrane protease YdiL (CAAX protease family)